MQDSFVQDVPLTPHSLSLKTQEMLEACLSSEDILQLEPFFITYSRHPSVHISFLTHYITHARITPQKFSILIAFEWEKILVWFTKMFLSFKLALSMSIINVIQKGSFYTFVDAFPQDMKHWASSNCLKGTKMEYCRVKKPSGTHKKSTCQTSPELLKLHSDHVIGWRITQRI